MKDKGHWQVLDDQLFWLNVKLRSGRFYFFNSSIPCICYDIHVNTYLIFHTLGQRGYFTTFQVLFFLVLRLEISKAELSQALSYTILKLHTFKIVTENCKNQYQVFDPFFLLSIGLSYCRWIHILILLMY